MSSSVDTMDLVENSNSESFLIQHRKKLLGLGFGFSVALALIIVVTPSVILSRKPQNSTKVDYDFDLPKGKC